jgi:hypothetical protein
MRRFQVCSLRRALDFAKRGRKGGIPDQPMITIKCVDYLVHEAKLDWGTSGARIRLARWIWIAGNVKLDRALAGAIDVLKFTEIRTNLRICRIPTISDFAKANQTVTVFWAITVPPRR